MRARNRSKQEFSLGTRVFGDQLDYYFLSCVRGAKVNSPESSTVKLWSQHPGAIKVDCCHLLKLASLICSNMTSPIPTGFADYSLAFEAGQAIWIF